MIFVSPENHSCQLLNPISLRIAKPAFPPIPFSLFWGRSSSFVLKVYPDEDTQLNIL